MNHRTPILLFLLPLLIISSLLLCSTWLGGQTLQQDMHQEKKQEEHRYKSGSISEDLDLEHLMGAEECVEGDESCIKRRMTAEAHLDYIYTQQHKP